MIIVYVLKNFILHTVFGQIEDDVANYANTYLLIVSASIPFIGMLILALFAVAFVPGLSVGLVQFLK